MASENQNVRPVQGRLLCIECHGHRLPCKASGTKCATTEQGPTMAPTLGESRKVLLSLACSTDRIVIIPLLCRDVCVPVFCSLLLSSPHWKPPRVGQLLRQMAKLQQQAILSSSRCGLARPRKSQHHNSIWRRCGTHRSTISRLSAGR